LRIEGWDQRTSMDLLPLSFQNSLLCPRTWPGGSYTFQIDWGVLLRTEFQESPGLFREPEINFRIHPRAGHLSTAHPRHNANRGINNKPIESWHGIFQKRIQFRGRLSQSLLAAITILRVRTWANLRWKWYLRVISLNIFTKHEPMNASWEPGARGEIHAVPCLRNGGFDIRRPWVYSPIFSGPQICSDCVTAFRGHVF
jgi:hypothetical protein